MKHLCLKSLCYRSNLTASTAQHTGDLIREPKLNEVDLAATVSVTFEVSVAVMIQVQFALLSYWTG